MMPLDRASACCYRRTQSWLAIPPRRKGHFIVGPKAPGRTTICSRIVAGPSVGDFQWGWEPRWRARIGRPLFSKATAAACNTPQALWTMAREKADVTLVVMKNESYGILNIELARVREGDP